MANKTDVSTIDTKGELQVVSKEVLRTQMQSALKEIDTKLKKLLKGTQILYKVIANFKMNENDNNNVNIQTSTDVVYLLKALALMKQVQKKYEETAKELQLVRYPVCLWLGSPVTGWIHDLTLRISLVTNADMINGLTEARKKLESFLTEEDRLSITLKEIATLINKS